jgi:hypothetical protein
VTFYTKDPTAQKKAMAELEQMDELVSSLDLHRTTITRQLQALEGEAPLPGLEAAHQQDGGNEQPQQRQWCGGDHLPTTTNPQGEHGEPLAKAKVLYSFQAQSEGEMSVFSGTIVTLLEPQPNGDWCASPVQTPPCSYLHFLFKKKTFLQQIC